MRHFIDGDQLVLTDDDFVDLQSSEAVFVPLDDRGKEILAVLEGAEEEIA